MSHKPLGYYCSAIQVPADIEATILSGNVRGRLVIASDMIESFVNQEFECGDFFADLLTADQIDWLENCHTEAYKSILKWIVNELI